MRYRNTISGEVIEVDAPISGEFWEDAEEAAEAETDDTVDEEAEEAETDEPKKKGRRKKA